MTTEPLSQALEPISVDAAHKAPAINVLDMAALSQAISMKRIADALDDIVVLLAAPKIGVGAGGADGRTPDRGNAGGGGAGVPGGAS